MITRKGFRSQTSVSQVVLPLLLDAALRFVSMRSSSSVDLDSSTLDDMRAERAAIALPVGLSWPPVKRRRSSWQLLWERALQEHILHHHELLRAVRIQRPDWWRPGGAIARTLTHEEIAYVSTPWSSFSHPLQPLHSLKTSPAAARQNAAKSRSTPSCATGSSTCPATGRQKGNGACRNPWVRSGACVPECSTGSTRTLRYRWKRSAAAPHGRKSLLSPADMTRVSEHILRVSDDEARRTWSPVTWPSSAASRAASRRKRPSRPLRHRRLVRWLGHEQGMAATVIGRVGGSRSHGPLRLQQGLEHGMASITRSERRRMPRGR